MRRLRETLKGTFGLSPAFVDTWAASEAREAHSKTDRPRLDPPCPRFRHDGGVGRKPSETCILRNNTR